MKKRYILLFVVALFALAVFFLTYTFRDGGSTVAPTAERTDAGSLLPSPAPAGN